MIIQQIQLATLEARAAEIANELGISQSDVIYRLVEAHEKIGIEVVSDTSALDFTKTVVGFNTIPSQHTS